MHGFPILVFTYFSEALIVYFYFRSIYETKLKKSSLIIIILCYIALMLIYRFVINHELINLILILICNIFICKCLFVSSAKSSVYHGIILTILQYISEFLTAYLMAWSLNASTEKSVIQHFEIASVISRIIYLLLSRLLAKLSIKENRAKSWGRWALLSLLPISSIFMILSIRLLTANVILSPVQNGVCMFSISFCLIVNIIVYVIYEKAEKSNQKLIELELANQKNNIDLQYLELLEKKNEKMQIMAHDYKNHIAAIEAMTNNEEKEQYLQDVLEEIANDSQIAKTKNRTLDVIISKYTDICEEKGIAFQTDILSDNLRFMHAKDLSAIFNNALDNAVEAAEQSVEKVITLHISRSINQYHKIIIENSSDREPLANDKTLLTTKKQKSGHGYGTKSIEKAVQKYDGETDWEYDKAQKQFCLTILIPSII